VSVIALSGGVGGAKLARGLQRVLAPDELSIIVNTADDFDHLGLRICPDLDSVLYALAGLDSPERGWGRRDETWTLMNALTSLGGEDWFRLGDGDTALHLLRTEALRGGARLTTVMRTLGQRLGVHAELLPMSDDPVATLLDTDEGTLAFQDYFVRRGCRPRVRAIRFDGAAAARVPAEVAAAFDAPSLALVVICPSNPYLSIDPLLAVPGLRARLAARRVPAIAVSPLIGATAVKGPTAKLMTELGIEVTTASIARHYAGLIDALVIDSGDAAEAAGLALPVFTTATLMRTLADRDALARFTLDCGRGLGGRRTPA
jgi:LPPG:FO 2-phospho-L-lactate transferase